MKFCVACQIGNHKCCKREPECDCECEGMANEAGYV